jgi:hypothetical protein
MAISRTTEEILILAKTYPTPSTQYRETTCVAGLTEKGKLRRLFPVPYRFLTPNAKFEKWEWMKASVATTPNDRRPESRRIDADSIQLLDKKIGTEDGWWDRRQLIEPHVVEDFTQLEARRKRSDETLGFLRPKAITKLIITPSKEPEWTKEDLNKLTQDGLFDSEEMKNRFVLRKVPFDFHYEYITGDEVQKHKITDWEVSMLFWNCRRSHGPDWEAPFRQKLEIEFQKRDLFFLMGTIHRFPDHWLIVGIVYPPKPPSTPVARQIDLGLGL